MFKRGEIVTISETNCIGVVLNTYLNNRGKQYCEILELNNNNTIPDVYTGYVNYGRDKKC